MRGCGNRGRAISAPVRLAADWLYTGTGDIIPHGAVLTDAGGRIAAAGADEQVPRSESARSLHFAGAALIPGLVNTHTHLELTGFEGRVAPADFTEWIRAVIRLKSERSPADFLQAANRGLQDCYAAGVTTVADTGDSGASFEALLEREGSGIAYLEVFGPDPSIMESQFEAFRARIKSMKPRQTARVRLGVSPHAPYSVSGPLYRRIAAFAAEEGLPVAVHVAESAAESDLLERAEGPFARQWESRGIPRPSLPGRTPLAWLDEHEVLGPRTLCIHVVRAGTGDIDRLRRHGCSVAHCPRSNRRHGHGDAPLARLLEAGLRVGVGTDSVASLAPLDLLAEARAARALAGLSAEQTLELVTLGAARALDLDPDVGSLEAGKFADCTVVRIPDTASSSNCLEMVLASGRADVVATFLGGAQVYRRP